MCQFPLFETLAVQDGIIQNIYYHQARYEQACRDYLQSKPILNFAEIIVPSRYLAGLVRCKVEYNAQTYQVQFFPYHAKQIDYFELAYLDRVDYQFKYSDRTIFQSLSVPSDGEKIIIHNGKVSDCSIGNLLFLKQGQWFSSKDYLLKGTQLSRLLDEGKISLCEICVEDLNSFEKVMMINALNPFNIDRALPIQAVRF